MDDQSTSQKSFEELVRYRCNGCGRVYEFDNITCACKAGIYCQEEQQERFDSYASAMSKLSKSMLQEELGKLSAFLAFCKTRIELISKGMSPDAQSYLDDELGELKALEIQYEICKLLQG